MMIFYKLKQCRQAFKSRVVRRYMRVLIRSILIAVLVWLLLFFYTFVYKFEKSIRTSLNRLLFSDEDNNKQLAPAERQNQNSINSEWGVYGNLKKNEFELAKIIDGKSLEFLKQIERRPYDVNCRSLIEWDEAEVRRAKRILYKLRNLNRLKNNPDNSQMLDTEPDQLIPLVNDENFIFPDSKCALFRDLRGYDKHKIDDLELNFPLAFSILTYNNVEQLERLLRTIYRPHNVYCIHVDSKSNKNVHAAIRSIAGCFNNVFIATKLEHIVYAGFNRLKADINCMTDLVYPNYSLPNLAGKNFSTDWRYMLNLASSEFPLRTNYELVRVLNMFNGANDIEVIRNFQKERVLYSWKVKKKPNSSVEYLVRTKRLKSDVPHNYTIVKGITYCSFSRKFVQYVLTNAYAKNLLKWSEDTYSPDEWYLKTFLLSLTYLSLPNDTYFYYINLCIGFFSFLYIII